MKKFRRKRGAAVTNLSPYEVELLSSLVSQLVEMISDGEPESYAQPQTDDPFELWAQDLASDPDQPETHEDPVLQRLFPERLPARRRRLLRLPPVHRARAEDQEGVRRAGRARPASPAPIWVLSICASRRMRCRPGSAP